MAYANMQTEFVLSKLRKTSFSKRKYIENLTNLEYFILNGAHNMAGNYLFRNLKGSYPREFRAIFKEIKLKEYKKWVEEQRRENEEEKRVEREGKSAEKRFLAEEKKQWLRLGGKL